MIDRMVPDNIYVLTKPTLCMIVGVPASGKTTLALQLTKQLVNGVYLSNCKNYLKANKYHSQ